ncbi:MAG: hypothetical protein OEY64_00645 [Nitrospinota bacterium]|nr:hypothetical protein [Nitrospinota bacterium]
MGIFFGESKWKPDIESGKVISAILDEVFTFASEKQNASHLERAKTLYYSKVGQTFEDDPDFIQRMDSFLEWFIFDYMPEGGVPGGIYKSYLEQKRHASTTDELLARMELANSHQSIFLVIEYKNGVVKVKDLVLKKKFYVTCEDNLEEQDILMTRIVHMKGKCHFSRSHCLHPKSALKFIKNAIRKIGKNSITPDLFLELGAMQLRWRRSRQIDIKHIYAFR